jgi:hypothetical protein
MRISLTKEQAQLIAYAIEKLVSSYSQGTQVRDSCEAIRSKLPKNIRESGCHRSDGGHNNYTQGDTMNSKKCETDNAQLLQTLITLTKRTSHPTDTIKATGWECIAVERLATIRQILERQALTNPHNTI